MTGKGAVCSLCYLSALISARLPGKLLLVGGGRYDPKRSHKGISPQLPAPRLGEQRPEEWWDAVVTGVPELLRGFDAK